MSIIDATKEVRILTKNCVDSASTITSSHGGTTSYFYDRDNSTQWTSVNGNRDTTFVVINITFNVAGVETQFTINHFMMLNCNIKDFTLEWYRSTDSTYVKVIDARIADAYGCYSFGAVRTSRMRLTLKTTQHPNQEKQVGDLIIARIRYVLSRGFASYDVSFRNKVSQIEMGDGSLAMGYSRPLGARIDRYGARCVFQFLPRADYDFLYCLKNEGDPFLFLPEAVSRPQEIWYVHWVNPFTASYMTSFVSNGYSLMMELQEV